MVVLLPKYDLNMLESIAYHSTCEEKSAKDVVAPDQADTLPWTPGGEVGSQPCQSPIQPMQSLSPSPTPILKKNSSWSMVTNPSESNVDEKNQGEEDEEAEEAEPEGDPLACPDHGNEVIELLSDEESVLSPSKTSTQKENEKNTDAGAEVQEEAFQDTQLEDVLDGHVDATQFYSPTDLEHAHPADTQAPEFEMMVDFLESEEDEKDEKKITKGTHKVWVVLGVAGLLFNTGHMKLIHAYTYFADNIAQLRHDCNYNTIFMSVVSLHMPGRTSAWTWRII